jgi:hypothetical protein
MVFVIVSDVGAESISNLSVVDNTVSPSLTGGILIFLVRPTAGSNCVAELS